MKIRTLTYASSHLRQLSVSKNLQWLKIDQKSESPILRHCIFDGFSNTMTMNKKIWTIPITHSFFLQLVRAKETNLKTGIVYGLRKPPQLLELFWKK